MLELLTILTVFLVSTIVLLRFFRKFTKSLDLVKIVLLPLGLFAVGFYMRIQGDLVDIGYFFTDFSFLFVYIVFAVTFLLGQIKYWRIRE